MFLPVVTIMILLLKSTPKVASEFLGSPIDAAEICWSDKEISVDNSTIPLIVYYLKSCADTLSVLQSRKKRDGLFSVLSLKIHDAIPAVNKAFYEGNVDYSTVHELHKLFENMEPYLNTNTLIDRKRNKRNWIKIRCTRSVQKQVMPLIIRANQTEKEEACNALIVVKKPGHRMRRQIPLPYMDNTKKPSKIVVPFVSKPRFSLNDTDSNSLLVKYYITGIKCLSLASEHNQDILVFNRNFYIWLLKCILPKLSKDDELYPAFGGVFKILETIQDKGLVDLNREIENTVGSEICLKPSALAKTDSFPSKKSGKVAIASSSFCIIITLILTSFLFLTWLLIVFLFIFCRCCRYHQIKRDSCSETASIVGDSSGSESGSKSSLLKKKDKLPNEDALLLRKESEKKLISTNEIHTVSTETQPLLLSSKECEIKHSKPSLEVLSIEPEPPKNTGFSKFITPVKKDKASTIMSSEISCYPQSDLEKEGNTDMIIRSEDDSLACCPKSRERWQHKEEIPFTIEILTAAEDDKSLDQKSFTVCEDSSLFSGKTDQLKLDESKEEPTAEVQSDCVTVKLMQCSTDYSEKSSASSVKTEQDFDNIQVDSSYKCEIKFCGEPPKCDQCSKNFYNDVKQMLQVLKSEEIASTPTETPKNSLISGVSFADKVLPPRKEEENKVKDVKIAKDEKKDKGEKRFKDDKKVKEEKRRKDDVTTNQPQSK